MASTRSYCHSPLTQTLGCETIPERLEDIANRFEGKEVYVFLYPDGNRVSISARELYQRVQKVAQWLVKHGVQRGDTIVLCLLNDLTGLVCNLAVIVAGAVTLNLIPGKDDGSDLKKLLTRAKNVSAIIVDPGEDGGQLKACSNLIHVGSTTDNVFSTSIPSLKLFMSTYKVKDSNIPNLLTLDDIENSDVSFIELPKLDPEDVCILLPTSGSTGEPKFVPRTHHQAQIIANQLKESMGFSESDIVWNERKMAWIGGFPFMLLYCGATTVTTPIRFARIEEHCDFTLARVREERCTIAALFPVTIIGLLQSADRLQGAVPMLKNIHTGALPVTKSCMAAIGKITRTVTNCYGSSEVGFATSEYNTAASQSVDYASGRPLAGVEVKVVDDNGAIVDRGVTGVVMVRSPSMFSGYYRDADNTAKVLGPTGWFDTDDTGYMTDGGSLVVAGRKSDTIMQGGMTVFPSIVEAYIKTFDKVLDVLVVPVPNVEFFQLACACVIPKPGCVLTAEDVRGFYTSHKLPSSQPSFGRHTPEIVIFDVFPKTHTGKPSKQLLRQEAMKRLGIKATKQN